MATYPGPIKFSQFTGASSRLLNDAGGNDRPASGRVACPKPWGVTEITLSAAGKTSRSFSERGHGEIAAGREADGRFYFAPKADQVVVAWKLKNPGNAGTVKLELFAAGSGVPIWQRSLATDDTRRERLPETWDGSFPAGEWSSAAFPHHLVTVEKSPYMMKITADASAEEGFVERWTYFNVLIDKIELVWGGRALIPAANPTDVSALHLPQTLLDEGSLVDALALQAGGDGVLNPGDLYDVKLPCNNFTSFSHDASDNNEQRRQALWQHHRDQWGDGPRIPLIAKVFVARAGGGGIHGTQTALALGAARFLWDWDSTDEIAALPGAGHAAAVTAFLSDSLDYQRNRGLGPPGSTNSHEDHGGKRGGDKQVWVRHPSLSTSSARCATRRWATHECAVLTGPKAGCVGLVFQPSRIALDNYQIHVFAPPEDIAGGAGLLDTVDAVSQLQTDHPSLPQTRSGRFQTLREIRIRYVRKSPAVQSAVLAEISQHYRKAGIVIRWASPGEQAADAVTISNQFDTWFTQAMANPDQKGAPTINKARPWIEQLDQYRAGTGADTRFGVIAPSWDRLVRPIRVDAIREYVAQKNRTIDTPNKRYQRWLAQPGNSAATDHTYLLPYYNQLSASKKAKVDVIFQRRLTAANLSTKVTYENDIESAAVHIIRLIAERMLVSLNEYLMLVFHVDTPMAWRQIDNSIVIPDSGTGGLSPSTSAQWGGRGGINLVYLPETPSLSPAAKYRGVRVTKVIAHEAAHNLFLCHAPKAPDAVDAQGAILNEAPGAVAILHDSRDKFCLMNYDSRSDHLCGYCNLKLRGWGTVNKRDWGPSATPLEDGLVKLWNDSTRNRQP